ncbi:Fur family transcriptional regulator [Microvirga terricola]|uniref:Transcriptional repressor n=1 Tax=Microvirga terricola TaxID=2719797 RepID=A0ABX0V5I6_9HYPH|nr:Fur family transcriptional regulator [Microvirga terricola]NIX75098.1 transcriptional repressor [Microvirga terricola]
MARTAAERLQHEASQGSCAHAVRQEEKAARALAQAEAICRAHGVRLTPIRRKVLETLYTTHKPLGAYDLAEALEPGGRRIAPITVYRALDFLIEQGLAHRLASQNAYIATFQGDSSHEATAFLICEECGGVDEVTSSALTETMANLLNAEGFRAHTKVLEVTGRCAHCQDAH